VHPAGSYCTYILINCSVLEWQDDYAFSHVIVLGYIRLCKRYAHNS